MTALVSRASEGCYLVRVLIENQLSRLSTLLEDARRKRLQAMSLKDLVCSKEGEDTMTQLISVLLDEHQKAAGEAIAVDLSLVLGLVKMRNGEGSQRLLHEGCMQSAPTH